MQFMKPPISTTNRPPGFKTFLTLVSTPKGSRLHQCNTALLKTASNFSKTSGSSSGISSDWASATKACLTPFALAFSICVQGSARRLFVCYKTESVYHALAEICADDQASILLPNNVLENQGYFSTSATKVKDAFSRLRCKEFQNRSCKCRRVHERRRFVI